jgi:gliding motility-associated protein GldC
MKKDIVFSIDVDENNVPNKIEWHADDQPEQEEAAAVMISLWDRKSQEALRMDLWNKDFTTDEMKVFFVQTLMTMNDTLERATGDTETCQGIREFGLDLGRRFGILDE